MKKEIKNFSKIIEVILIVLTIISLIISALTYTNTIYNWSYDTTNLNNLVISKPFTILLWIDNILIYIISIFYIVDTIKENKNKLIKLSFCIFSVCTTIICSTMIINGIAKLFKIF